MVERRYTLIYHYHLGNHWYNVELLGWHGPMGLTTLEGAMVEGIIPGLGILGLCVFLGGWAGGRIGGTRGVLVSALCFLAGLVGLVWFTLGW